MAVWLAEKALLPDGWANNVGITVSEEGIITALEKNAAPNPQATRIKGVVVPGMPNLHSHAFQRAMVRVNGGGGKPVG